MTEISMRDLWTTSNVSWSRGRGTGDEGAKGWSVGRPRAKSTVSIVVRTRWSKWTGENREERCGDGTNQ